MAIAALKDATDFVVSHVSRPAKRMRQKRRKGHNHNHTSLAKSPQFVRNM